MDIETIALTPADLSAFESIKKQRTLFGHPAGLYVLFFTEMWERFSYYGMRALLILYLTKHLINSVRGGAHVVGFGLFQYFWPNEATQPLSSHIYGLYTAFVYFTPIFGGMLADRVLGQRKTVYLGAVVMAIGHFLMAIESMFLLALLFLVLGNGCFKPNISTQVGGLYPPGDHRRDGAFTIFYMGVNLGAFLAPLVCGTLGQLYGWHYGFAAAGVGMCIGLVVYHFGQDYLAPDQLTLSKSKAKHIEAQPLTKKERIAVAGLIALLVLNIPFWAVYEQQGNTLQLFADANTDWHIFGWEMPSTWFQSVNALFIFTLGPVLISLWNWQSRRKSEPSSVTKMAIGCVALGLSFILLMIVSHNLLDTQRIHFMWLVSSTFIYTIGELYVSPIGLSFVTKVAPARLVSMLMGAWFLSYFFGNYLEGYLGTFYEKMPKESFFMMLMILGVGSGLAIFILGKPLKNAVGHDT